MTLRETPHPPAMAGLAVDGAHPSAVVHRAPDAAPLTVAPLTVAPLADGHGLEIRGEADLATARVLAGALTSVTAGTGDVHLQLSGLVFVDVASVAELVHAAARLGPDRTLVLHSPPRTLRSALDRFWPQWPGLRVGTP